MLYTMPSFAVAIILIVAYAAAIPLASGFAARDASSRMRRPPPNRTRRSPNSETVEKRAPHQFDHTKEEARPFLDNRLAVKGQLPNDDAPLYTFKDDDTQQATIIPD